jgi:hypothetical protein
MSIFGNRVPGGGNDMNNIVINPDGVYSLFVGVCSLIITASGAFAVIERAIKHFKAPQEADRKQIADIADRVTATEDSIKRLDSYIARDNVRLNDFETSDKATKIALLALLNHALDGNNTDDVRAAKKDLERYLIDK